MDYSPGTMVVRLLLLLVVSVFGAVHGAESIPNFETIGSMQNPDYRGFNEAQDIKSIVFGLEPSFDVPVINVTVQEGDMAVLPCSVDYLGDHKVVWTDKWSTLLTLDDRRIIDDPRISIERPFTRDWNLHIRKVVYTDRGKYICQINTNPVKTKTVMLIVLVPSKISAELSSKDKTVREGDTVQLICNVTGVPTPEVTWYKLPSGSSLERERLDLEPGSYTLIDSCAYTLKKTEIGSSGEVLIIHNVSRYCDGAYECVAYNNVDPAVTRQIKVFVEFPPEVSLPVKRIGHYIGMETILDCEITAHPHGYMGWSKDGEEINDRDNKNKYRLELYSGNEDDKKKTLSLRINDIAEEDFGQYVCFAKNMIGEDKETMLLYDYAVIRPRTQAPTPRPSTTQTTIVGLPDLVNGFEFTPDDTVHQPDYGRGQPDGRHEVRPNDPYMPGEAALGDPNGAASATMPTLSVLYAMNQVLTLLRLLNL